jgi:hypothetical protein
VTTDGLAAKFAVLSKSFGTAFKFFAVSAANIGPALIGFIGRKGAVTLEKNIFLLFKTEARCF